MGFNSRFAIMSEGLYSERELIGNNKQILLYLNGTLMKIR